MKVIFIGGTGRSGTTVLKRAFGRSSKASILDRELHVHIRKGGMLAIDQRNRALSEEELERVAANYKQSDTRAIPALRVANDTFARTGNITRALEVLFRRAFGSNGVPVEDTPDNMWHAEALAEALPDALFIHMVRHPLYVLQSTHKMHWGRPTYAGTAQYLATSYERCLNSERALGKRCIRIRHEDLCDDPTRTLAKISVFTTIDIRSAQGIIDPRAARARTISAEARTSMGPLAPYVARLGY